MQTPTSSISDAVNSSTAARRPRLSFTAEERQAVLERYRSSGLKQQEFIAGEGISKATLGVTSQIVIVRMAEVASQGFRRFAALASYLVA